MVSIDDNLDDMEKKERNNRVRKEAAKGEKSYSSIGAIYGISKQRVHQIVRGVDKSLDG